MGEGDEIIKPTRQRMARVRAAGFDEVVETSRGGVTRKNGAVREWSQLENLHRNHIITDEEYAAGKRFEIDHRAAGYDPRVTMRWTEWIQGLAGSPEDLNAAERREFHRKRWHKACDVLEELGTRKLMHWFIVENIKPEQIARQHWGLRGKHTASGRAVGSIKTSLFRLAKFYGLVK